MRTTIDMDNEPQAEELAELLVLAYTDLAYYLYHPGTRKGNAIEYGYIIAREETGGAIARFTSIIEAGRCLIKMRQAAYSGEDTDPELKFLLAATRIVMLPSQATPPDFLPCP